MIGFNKKYFCIVWRRRNKGAIPLTPLIDFAVDDNCMNFHLMWLLIDFEIVTARPGIGIGQNETQLCYFGLTFGWRGYTTAFLISIKNL